jgi:hypothetical protein
VPVLIQNTVIRDACSSLLADRAILRVRRPRCANSKIRLGHGLQFGQSAEKEYVAAKKMVNRVFGSGLDSRSGLAQQKSMRARSPENLHMQPVGEDMPQTLIRGHQSTHIPVVEHQHSFKAKEPPETHSPNSKEPVAASNLFEEDAESIYLEHVEGWSVEDVSDGIAVHDSTFSSVHHLNNTAAAIYLLCRDTISLSVILTILREEVGIIPDSNGEIVSVIEGMVRIGLLRQSCRQVTTCP